MASVDEPADRILTAPNLLTLSRLPLAGAVWIAPERPSLLIPVMVAAAASDLLDGRLARAIRARRVARGEPAGLLAAAGGVGAWLDPVCDKAFVLSVVAAIFVTVRPRLLVLGLIALRELLLIPLVAVYRLVPGLRGRKRFDFRAGLVGKLTTVAQFAALVAITLAPAAVWPLAIAAAVLGGAAVVVYTRRAAEAAAA